MESKFINYNGELISTEDSVITHNNRSFLYGDGFFESIRVIEGRPCFLSSHLQRIQNASKLLGLELGDDFSLVYLQDQIGKLLIKNQIRKGGKIRLNVFRKEGGKYASETNLIDFIFTANSIESNLFELNEKGLVIDIYKEHPKPITRLGSVKTCNSLYYVLAANYAKEKRIDESLLINTNGQIIEGNSSNIFLVKNREIKTPKLSGGCVNGVMRTNIIALLKQNAFSVSEIDILEKDLLEADEVFLTNASTGIRWVKAYKGKRFFNRWTRNILNRLNAVISNSVSDLQES